MYTGTRGNIHFGLQLQMTTCGCLALTLGSMVGVCISKHLFVYLMVAQRENEKARHGCTSL